MQQNAVSTTPHAAGSAGKPDGFLAACPFTYESGSYLCPPLLFFQSISGKAKVVLLLIPLLNEFEVGQQPQALRGGEQLSAVGGLPLHDLEAAPRSIWTLRPPTSTSLGARSGEAVARVVVEESVDETLQVLRRLLKGKSDLLLDDLATVPSLCTRGGVDRQEEASIARRAY
jgi:hypothetical protein